MDQETTISLLRKAKSGDRTALDRLCERYRPRLVRWAAGRLSSKARSGLDTDDLVQEALLATVEKLDSFEPRHGGALQAYLYKALRHRLYDASARARSRLREAPTGSDPADSSPSPLEQLIGREALNRYESALERLAEDDRAAIVMKIEWGFSHGEIAAELGKPSPDAARMTVNRALVRLAREMGHG